MNVQDFLGIWRSERGAPYSTQTFTWTATDGGLRGECVIEVVAPPPGMGTWMSTAGPRRHDMPIGPPIFEEDRALFTVNNMPYVAEFRLLGNGEAAFGAAMDKLPPELAGPEHQRSIDAHRVRLTRIADATTTSSERPIQAD
jgi:hypothetical protein